MLNLSISSREIKAKALSLLSNVLDRYYKGFIDTIAGGYIENMLKSSKNWFFIDVFWLFWCSLIIIFIYHSALAEIYIYLSIFI